MTPLPIRAYLQNTADGFQMPCLHKYAKTIDALSISTLSIYNSFLDKFKHGEDYRGSFYSNSLTPLKRYFGVSSAIEIYNHDPGYTFSDIIDARIVYHFLWWERIWHGKVTDIDDIRCDGITEFSYEKNGIEVAMNSNITYDLNHLDGHNDLH